MDEFMKCQFSDYERITNKIKAEHDKSRLLLCLPEEKLVKQISLLCLGEFFLLPINKHVL